jgi:hypothetical protein
LRAAVNGCPPSARGGGKLRCFMSRPIVLVCVAAEAALARIPTLTSRRVIIRAPPTSYLRYPSGNFVGAPPGKTEAERQPERRNLRLARFAAIALYLHLENDRHWAGSLTPCVSGYGRSRSGTIGTWQPKLSFKLGNLTRADLAVFANGR